MSVPPTIRDLVRVMEGIAPTALAADWDNVGLLVGSPGRPLSGPVLLTIDLTERVLAEACTRKAAAIAAYHPPIWNPVKSLTDATPGGRVLLGAIEARIAVYSSHTALDAAPGGMTDWLCEGLSGGSEGKVAGDVRSLEPHAGREETQEVKIVTFVPVGALESVRNALATAGAGIIGRYRVCSFQSHGHGTFFGDETTRPAVGEAGRLEEVEEHRLEMVCSRAALPLALETLRRFHPYEVPAVDVYELLALPDRHAGAGRRIVLDQPATLRELASRLKGHLGVSAVQVAAAEDLDKPLAVLGVCPGSGASLASAARAEGCEVFITGEMKHHEVAGAVSRGLSVVLAGHTETERGYLPRLAQRISAALPGVETVLSREDRAPLIAL